MHSDTVQKKQVVSAFLSEKEKTHRIMQEIDIYKGVSREDIDKRTPRFLGYASTILEYEKS